MSKVLILLVIFLSSCGVSSKTSTRKALLRFQPKTGEVYALTLNMSMKITGPQTMRMQMEVDNDIKIDNVSTDGNFYLENTITRMKMFMKNVLVTIEYDSDSLDMKDPNAQAMHESMSKMINQPMVSQMSSQGKMLQEPDYNEMFQGDRELKRYIDEMNSALQNAFISYPDNPVKVGDVWHNKIVDDGDMAMTQTFTYTVKEITTTTVNLDVKGTLALHTNRVSGSGTSKGSIIIDRINGFAKSSTLTQTIDMTAMSQSVRMVNELVLGMNKK